MSFSRGDIVCFKGDPDGVPYRTEILNSDGSWDLCALDREDGAYDPEYVPERLLELAPVRVDPGTFWKVSEEEDGYEDPEYPPGLPVFVTRVDGDIVSFVHKWDTTVSTVNRDYFVRNYTPQEKRC